MRKIKLMPDYQCHPLWEASPGLVGNIDPTTLPISPGLIARLAEWAHSYDATLNLDDPLQSGFKNVAEKQSFIDVGNQLAEALQAELGDSYLVKAKI
jgi:hypothetical protein